METNITINSLALFISLDCVQCAINRIEPVTTYGNQHHHQLLGSFYLFRLCPMYNKQNKASYNIWKPTSPSTSISFYLFRLCPMYNKQNKASYNIWKPTSPSTPISFYLFRLCPMYNKQNKASYNIWKPTSPSTPYLFLSL